MNTETTQARVSGTLDPIVRHSTFWDWFDIGTDADVVILATNDGGGLVPRKLCLPHQVYVKTVRELEATHHARVTAIPAKSGDYIDLPNNGFTGKSAR